MPIKKKKISELNEAGDLTGFFTIGYRVINGVKESVKYGLQKIQDLYENLIKAISDAGEATTDMRELEATVETNENTRETAESERSTSEQARQAAELSRANAESSRVTAEDSRNTVESGRVAAENARSAAETSRQSAESSRELAESNRIASETARVEAEAARVTEFATIKQNAETATTNANTATTSAYAAAEAADAAKEAATEVAGHPTYVGTDNYVYAWNTVTKSYDRTNIYVKGEAFNISKVYASVSALEADSGNADIKEGAFVLVNTNDVENPDNARLYVKVKNPDGSYRYNFLVDMSGAIGFTGKTPQFTKGTITTGEAGTDVQLSLSESGTDPEGNPVVALNLVIPRGNPGVPFKVLGHYDTLDALKAAVPDGTNAEGVYAVGMELPYEYYAWYETKEIGSYPFDFTDASKWQINPVNGESITTEYNSHQFRVQNVSADDLGFYLLLHELNPAENINISLKISGLTGGDKLVVTNGTSAEGGTQEITTDGTYTFSYSNNGSDVTSFVIAYTVPLAGAKNLFIEQVPEQPGFNSAWIFNDDFTTTHTLSSIHLTAASKEQEVIAFREVPAGESIRLNLQVTGLVDGQEIRVVGANSDEQKATIITQDGIYKVEYSNIRPEYADLFAIGYKGAIGPCAITIELIHETVFTWISQGRLQGTDGKSAYQVAVDGGFSGTEAEWLASLKGEKGDSPHVNWNETDVNSSAFIENKPSSMPASDVYSWAKAANKPSYNINEISDADSIRINAGTITKKVISAATKNEQGYVSRVALGLSNPAHRFSPAILSVGLNDSGTNWIDFVFDIDGSLHASGGFFKDSDVRLKSHITPLSHTLEQLLSIPTSSFEMDGKTQIGSIAQEVEKVCPEIISEGYKRRSEVPDANDWEVEIREEHGKNVEYVKIKQVEYELLGILALEGVKLLAKEVEELRNRLNDLEV